MKARTPVQVSLWALSHRKNKQKNCARRFSWHASHQSGQQCTTHFPVHSYACIFEQIDDCLRQRDHVVSANGHVAREIARPRYLHEHIVPGLKSDRWMPTPPPERASRMRSPTVRATARVGPRGGRLPRHPGVRGGRADSNRASLWGKWGGGESVALGCCESKRRERARRRISPRPVPRRNRHRTLTVPARTTRRWRESRAPREWSMRTPLTASLVGWHSRRMTTTRRRRRRHRRHRPRCRCRCRRRRRPRPRHRRHRLGRPTRMFVAPRKRSARQTGRGA